MRALLIVVVLAIAGGRANAYPQFQLSRDQTCVSCHISPAGGGLLNENGTNFAETMSAYGTDPQFLNGAVTPPDWLQLGGDFRAMGGYLKAPQQYLWAFPMQGDLYGAATYESFSLNVTLGMRTSQEGNEALTWIWPREHYLQWTQVPGGNQGAFVRLGQLMPVFGLRYIEHPIYTRRFGGTPLFSETYGLSASYVTARYEAHLTGFIENPLIDPVRLNSGGSAYGELRIDDQTQLGVGGMAEISDFDSKFRGTVTAKRYLTAPEVLLQGEVQLVNPHVSGYGYTQIVSYLMATYFAPMGFMVDVAWGHFDENTRIAALDRDTFYLNIHWFTTSHLELLSVNRVEYIAWGEGGPVGAVAMLQVHYRL